jgi:enoyl-CoA hydratase/carnithine racemase
MLYDFLTATDVEEIERVNREYFEYIGKQPDAMEGVISFLQKRAPEWSMKVPGDMPDF